MKKNKASDVIEGLAENTDLQRTLAQTGLSAAGALKLLQGKEGRRQLAARKMLARIQVELLAHRYGALAMYKVCGMLNEAEAGLRLKGAMAVLEAMGEGETGNPKSEGAGATEQEGGAAPGDSEEMTELLTEVAEVLGNRRRAEFRAPDNSGGVAQEGVKGVAAK